MARYDIVTGTTNVDVSMADLRGRGGVLNWSAMYVCRSNIVQCLVQCLSILTGYSARTIIVVILFRLLIIYNNNAHLDLDNWNQYFFHIHYFNHTDSEVFDLDQNRIKFEIPVSFKIPCPEEVHVVILALFYLLAHSVAL